MSDPGSEFDHPLAVLRGEWGLDFARLRPLIARLAAAVPATVTELVEASGLPRRNVEEILRTLDPAAGSGPATAGTALIGERAGDGTVHWKLTTGATLRLAELTARRPAAAAAALAGPMGELTARRPAAAALGGRMAELAAGLPAARWRLDHVPATAETMVARALYLAGQYELAGASVLCLGDHDLTSLAVGLVAPSAELAVVDIDELILDHIRGQGPGVGVEITTAAADLRLGLPPSLAATADLVFTDPPYTTEGMRLFLARAVEGLRKSDHARIVFCYGTGERHLGKAVEIQGVLGDLRLAIEAVLPGFNRYSGAEAIGSRSALYVCRPTPKTWTRRPFIVGDPRIYTRGPDAEEAGGGKGDPPPEIDPAAALAEPRGTAVPVFAARTAAWATGTKPGAPPFGVEVRLDLGTSFGGSLTRLLLMSGAERAVFTLSGKDLAAAGWMEEGVVKRLVDSVFDVDVAEAGDGRGAVVVTAGRHGRGAGDPVAHVLAHLVTHPGAKVVNGWREGLVGGARPGGVTVTKNQARAAIEGAGFSPPLGRLRPFELPRSSLAELVAAVERSVALLEAQDHGAAAGEPEPGGGQPGHGQDDQPDDETAG